MTPRGSLLLLLCALGCLAGLGVIALGLGTDSVAAELAVPVQPAQPEPAEPVAIEAPATPGPLTAAEGVFRREDRAAVVEATPAAKPTSGTIRGDVTLEATAARQLRSITIKVTEAMRDDGEGGRRYSKLLAVRFDPSEGTPTFCIREVPFSDFGYVVQALAPGFNGTEQTVHVNERNPIADVVLGVHPGTPFSVLLRDQDMAPLVDVEVTMNPQGPPAGRQPYYKKTDSFGAAVFDSVLRGTYQVVIGGAQPLLPPEPLEVFASSGTQVQSKTIVIPRGEALTVNLYAPTGTGIPGVAVKLSSGSDVRYREVEQTTDFSGRTTFQHLAPGSYWINVLDSRYEQRTVPATVKAGEKPKDVDIRLLMR